MHKRFASIAQPEKYGFAYDTDAYSTHPQTDNRFRAFETYGDGLTQHSGDWSVAPDMLADYLASLTQAMLDDDELCGHASGTLIQGPRADTLAFAATLIAKPSDLEYGSKRRYWSLTERKISTNPAKQHDKRYQEFSAWMDGSATAILGIVTQTYADPYQRYCYAEAVRVWVLAQPEQKKRSALWMELPAIHMQWVTDHDKARNLHAAYEMAVNAVKAHELRKTTASQLDCYRHNTAPRPVVEVEAAAA